MLIKQGTQINLKEMDINGKVVAIFNLKPKFDKEFDFTRGNPKVIRLSDGSLLLSSFTGIAAAINRDRTFYSNGEFSYATTRHQQEFDKQFAAKPFTRKLRKRDLWQTAGNFDEYNLAQVY